MSDPGARGATPGCFRQAAYARLQGAPAHRLVPLEAQCDATTEWGPGMRCHCTLLRGHQGAHMAEDESLPLEAKYRVVDAWPNRGPCGDLESFEWRR